MGHLRLSDYLPDFLWHTRRSGAIARETDAASTGWVHEAQATYGAAGANGEEMAVLPFDFARLPDARRVVVEAGPASTLERLGRPHQNYKQSGAAPLISARRKTRRVILVGLAEYVAIGRVRRQILMRDNGDALDAVIAAVGAALSWRETDHPHVAAHPRYVVTSARGGTMLKSVEGKSAVSSQQVGAQHDVGAWSAMPLRRAGR